jgi:hypothetical protein
MLGANGYHVAADDDVCVIDLHWIHCKYTSCSYVMSRFSSKTMVRYNITTGASVYTSYNTR